MKNFLTFVLALLSLAVSGQAPILGESAWHDVQYTLDGDCLVIDSLDAPAVDYCIWPSQELQTVLNFPAWGQRCTEKELIGFDTWESQCYHEAEYTAVYQGFKDRTPIIAFITFHLETARENGSSRIITRIKSVLVFAEDNLLQPWE